MLTFYQAQTPYLPTLREPPLKLPRIAADQKKPPAAGYYHENLLSPLLVLSSKSKKSVKIFKFWSNLTDPVKYAETLLGPIKFPVKRPDTLFLISSGGLAGLRGSVCGR